MRFPALLLAAALTLGACRSARTELTAKDRSALANEADSAVVALVEAMNAHDSTAVLSHYAHDDTFSYVGVTDVLFGFDTFRRDTQRWYANHPDVEVHYQIVQTQVLSPTVAVVVMRGSSTLQSALAATEVLVRSPDGQWRIVHEHESWPDSTVGSRPHPLTQGP
jgi:uncharacterized protein (TIGR02246 family)